jgi:hypothetical protein
VAQAFRFETSSLDTTKITGLRRSGSKVQLIMIHKSSKNSPCIFIVCAKCFKNEIKLLKIGNLLLHSQREKPKFEKFFFLKQEKTFCPIFRRRERPQCFQEKMLSRYSADRQCDQIGRNFAIWAIFVGVGRIFF